MIKHWTEFEGSPNRTDRERARVTLNKKGVMLLNRVAFDALGMPAAVRLLFDEQNKIIGLKPEDIRRPNAFPVKQKDKWFNRVIHTSPFCKHFGIRIERTVLFNEVDIDNDGVMQLALGKTTAIGTGTY